MKKILSFIMALIMAFGSITFSKDTEVFASNEIAVQSKNTPYHGYFIYGSTETQPLRTKIDYYVDKDGTERMAYCIEPLKSGVSEVGTYSVNASSYSSDPVVWGILLNGYPNKSIDELGVLDESQAYYITKMALWMHIQYDKMGSWRAINSSYDDLLDKTKQLYEKGKTYTSINKSQYVITPETQLAIADGNYMSQTFTVTSDTASNPFTVVLDGLQPSGTKITDMSGTDKNAFQLAEKFKISVPKDSFENNGTFNFSIDGDLKTCLVLKGMPNDNIKQAYALQTEFSAESAKGTVSYEKLPHEEVIPPEKTPNAIQIFKLESGTKIPLAGAEFKITDADGGVLGHFYSDGNGQVTVPVTEGTYYIDEITPPLGYELDKITHKDVIVRKDEPTIVTFENHKEPSLEVLKVDSDTGEPLSGATIRIMEESSYRSYDEITDAKGIARFEGLKSGVVYRVKEIVPPEHYILDSTCENIILNAGQLQKITIKNKKKPSLSILKYDELTSKPLDGAEFSVAKKGGQILWEGIVSNGEIILEDLPEGWLTITELAAPKGYLKRDGSKDIYLEKGGTVTVKFDNRLKPSLQILKVDNNLKPLEGVKYKVTKLEDKTVSEYFTDAMGQIIIYDLDEAIYKVEELSTLDTHIIDTKPKEIQLEWGKQKTLLFKNYEKPKLEILKIDSVTKEPIINTKFQVKKIEDSTISEYLTDKDGRIFIENLDEGIYQVLETVANSEYILHNGHKEIELKGGDNKTLIFENERKPTLIITKINALTQKGIPNTTFKIESEQSNGGIKNLGTFKTDSNGQIIIENAAVGWHVITELIPAQGMQLPSNPISRKYLSAGENAYKDTPNNDGNANNGSGADTGQNTNIEVKSGHDYMDEQGKIITNFPLNALVIKKNDAITSEMLEGAVFEVRKIDGQLSGTSGTIIGRYTTDSSGIIVITGLEAGGYIVEEVKSPTNYLISENSKQTTWLKADGTSAVEVTFSNFPYGHILVTKVDSITNKPLANARFKVTGGDGSVIGNTTGEFVTDENGQFLVENIKPQTVTVTEIEAPENYAIDTTPQTVNVGTDGKTYKVSFKNKPYGNLVIKKFNKATNEPLANAEFFVTDTKGAVIGDGNGYFVTDNQGVISIPNLDKQSLIVKETKAPDGFILEQQTQTINIEYGKTHTLNFYNAPKSGLQIVKIDAVTKMPLKDAKFKVYHMNNQLVGEYQTDGNGLIILDNLSNGWYKIYESKAPDGYLIDDTPKDVEIKGNQFLKLTFENKKMTGLIIKKIDEDSKIPLSGVHFRVEKQSGELIHEGETDENGLITLPALSPDFYVIRETKEKDGYILDNQSKVVEVKTNTPTVVTITNKKLGGLQIRKVDQDNTPLSGVHFSVEKMNGEKVSNDTLITDNDGLIFLPDLVGDFVIRETKGKDGYKIDGTPRNTTIKLNELKVEKFINTKLGGLQIKKTDQDNNPLSNVIFSVEKMTGEKVPSSTGNYEHVTDNDGLIFIPDLEGDFIIREIKGKNGYKLETAPRNTRVRLNEITVEKFVNEKLGGLQIRKVDQNNTPLSRVHFSVEKMNGEKVSNDELITDNDGLIFLPDLVGDFVIRETKGKDGYKIDGTPRNTTVKLNELKVEKFINTKLGGLQIKKINSVTHEPIENVEFTVKKFNGELVGVYKTGKDGLLFVSDLNGIYTYQETKAADGFITDEEPHTIEIKLGELKTEIVENTPTSSLFIKKTDMHTKKPLMGVKFEVTKDNGEKVGIFETDRNGYIYINELPSGKYKVFELEQLNGYELDTKVYDVIVKKGEQTKLEIQNKKLAGLKIKKIDSITKKGIQNVEFMVFDADGKAVGNFYTDNNGIIDFAGILAEGRYTIRETRPAENYYNDDLPRTVEFIAGKYTELVWENQPKAGQIQITKLSADANEVSGLEAGTPLEGAIFGVYEYKSGNIVDRFITGYDGKGVSKPLPLGRYIVKEEQAPPYFKLNKKELDITIEFATQIVKLEFTNESANIGVSIDKVAPKEVMPNQEIRYDIKRIRNDSVINLTDFYVRDTLPIDAVRLEKIVTGTFNQSLKYKIAANTNKGNTIVIADNLMTTKNNVIDCYPSSLGLANDEFVISFTFYFGNVKAGFCNVEETKIYAKTLNKAFPNGYRFSNKVDIGGKTGGEWVIGNSTATTTIYSPTTERLPKTGN